MLCGEQEHTRTHAHAHAHTYTPQMSDVSHNVVVVVGSQAETPATEIENMNGFEATLDAAGRPVCEVEDSESDWSTDSDEEIITKDKVRLLQQPDVAPIKDVPKTVHEVLVPENVSNPRYLFWLLLLLFLILLCCCSLFQLFAEEHFFYMSGHVHTEIRMQYLDRLSPKLSFSVSPRLRVLCVVETS